MASAQAAQAGQLADNADHRAQVRQSTPGEAVLQEREKIGHSPDQRAPQGRSSPERELDRYLKLVARLKWKLPFLAQGYHIATDRVGRRSEEVATNEIHFKIDFYECVTPCPFLCLNSGV